MSKKIYIINSLLLIIQIFTSTKVNAFKPIDFIQNMRNEEGIIPYRLQELDPQKWGWNDTACMYSIGLALKGTPFEGQYNIDQAITTASQKGILEQPNCYDPKPGDLAIVPTRNYPDGGHAVMITENGGTIQNGLSHGTVYEDNRSPTEIFGKVNYYISLNMLYDVKKQEKNNKAPKRTVQSLFLQTKNDFNDNEKMFLMKK